MRIDFRWLQAESNLLEVHVQHPKEDDAQILVLFVTVFS